MAAIDDDLELASRLCLRLMRVGTRMVVGFDQRFTAFGLTQAQFRLLLAVWSCDTGEGVTPTTLAEHLFIERATVSVLVKKLLDRGVLERRAGANRRSYRVALTASSGVLLREMAPRARALADTTFESFTTEEQRNFEALLKKLEERLRRDAQKEPA